MNDTSPHVVFTCNGKELNFSRRTFLMGVLNVTPDSFSDGGKYFSAERAIAHAEQMIADGADIIDIGGESTRPNAEEISVDEELRRVIPVIQQLKKQNDVIISIDTYKSIVAEQALQNGASIVNDISGLKFDERMVDVIANNKATLVAMHIQGTPKTMQNNPSYNNVVAEVKEELCNSVQKAHAAGIQQIIIDPGIGFGKNLQHNLMLLHHLHEFEELGCPILVGTSRKRFIGDVLNLPVNERLEGTAATVAVAVMNGAKIIRVHDVKEMKRVAVMVDAIQQCEVPL